MAAPNGVHQAGGRGGAAAALYAAGRPPAGGLSPLSESLWKARAESTSIAVPSPHDFSARLTWIDLWVTVTGKGSKQAILQGLTGTTKPFISKLAAAAAAVCLSVCLSVSMHQLLEFFLWFQQFISSFSRTKKLMHGQADM
jgi:hypothetical protein